MVKAYVLTTGILSGLLAVVHVWRMIVEPNLSGEAWFILATVGPAALAIWAWPVLRRVGKED